MIRNFIYIYWLPLISMVSPILLSQDLMPSLLRILIFWVIGMMIQFPPITADFTAIAGDMPPMVGNMQSLAAWPMFIFLKSKIIRET
jgi:hypothetical protein